MTPEQKIKATILLAAFPKGEWDITEDNIDDLYEENDVFDTEYEFREGQVETKISSEYSRHYESKSVASQMYDGTWVGWTYWYGGGKHGEPDSISWMDEAYDLDVKEEEKLVIVRTFTKKIS